MIYFKYNMNVWIDFKEIMKECSDFKESMNELIYFSNTETWCSIMIVVDRKQVTRCANPLGTIIVAVCLRQNHFTSPHLASKER